MTNGAGVLMTIIGWVVAPVTACLTAATIWTLSTLSCLRARHMALDSKVDAQTVADRDSHVDMKRDLRSINEKLDRLVTGCPSCRAALLRNKGGS